MRLLTLFLLVCFALTTNAQTETENNNSFSTANTVNSIPGSIEGKIGEKGDADFFKFEINQSGVLETRITNIDPNCTLKAELFDSDQNSIIAEAEYTSNSPLAFNKRICDSDIYYLKIKANSSYNKSDQSYNLSLNLDTEDIYECNDDFQNAAEVNLSEEIKAKIKEKQDVDFFKFEIKQSGVLETTITNIDPNCTLKAELFDSDQNSIIAEAEYTSNSSLAFNKRICDSGIYYLKIKANSSNNESDQLYNLSLNLDTEDIYECNDDFQNAAEVNLGDDIKAKIKEKQDVDFFKFEINQSGVLETIINNIDPSCTLKAELFDSNQNSIISEVEYTSNSPLAFNKRICNTGIYYLKIKANSSATESDQTYNLSLNLDTEDIYECNDDFKNAAEINLGEDIKAKIREKQDVDFFKFEINQSGTLETIITDIDPNCTLEVELFDNNQNSIVSKYEYQENAPITFNTRICDNGIYYLKIKANSSSAESDQTYNLSLNLDTEDIYECNDNFKNATKIDLCNNYKASLNSVDDIDYFTFNISSKDTVTIELKEIPSYTSPEIRVYDGEQNFIDNIYFDKGKNGSLSFVPEKVGDYYFSIEDYSYNSPFGKDLFIFNVSNIGCGTTSTFENDSSNNLLVVPNPATDRINIQYDGNDKIQQIKLFDISGNLLGKYQNESEINISQYPSGILFVQFISENGILTKKIIKQ